MGLPDIKIDTGDQHVLEFLESLGFENSELQDGRLSVLEIEKRGRDYYSLELLSQLDLALPSMKSHYEKYQVTGYCSGIVQGGGGDILTIADLDAMASKIGDEDIRYLFSNWNHDPGDMTETWSLVLLANKLGVSLYCNTNARMNVPASVPEQLDLHELEHMAGLHIPDSLVSPDIHSIGLGVSQIRRLDRIGPTTGNASAVAVSADGKFFTAKHCLFDEKDGHFFKTSIVVDGKQYRIRENNILYVDSEYDFVYFRVPHLKTPNFLSVSADDISADSQIVVIGNPALPQGDDRRYSFGRMSKPGDLEVDINYYSDLTLNNYLWTSALGWFGYSGGAIVDIKTKRLLGIATTLGYKNSKIENNTVVGTAGVPISRVLNRLPKDSL